MELEEDNKKEYLVNKKVQESRSTIGNKFLM